MKKLLFIILLTAGTAQAQVKESPCNDSLYISLKSVPLNKMTEREFSYFSQKEKDCAAFQSVQLQEKTKSDAVKKTSSFATTYIVLSLVLLGVALIPVMLLKQ